MYQLKEKEGLVVNLKGVYGNLTQFLLTPRQCVTQYSTEPPHGISLCPVHPH